MSPIMKKAVKKESQPPSPLFNRILIQKVIQQIQQRPAFPSALSQRPSLRYQTPASPLSPHHPPVRKENRLKKNFQ